MVTERAKSTESRRPTGWDVAQLCGLSRSTVSQILNGNHMRFSQETRDRVTQAAAALNYRPSRAGRALVTGRSDIIVLVLPNVTFGRYLQDAIDEIMRSSAADGMSVVVRYTGSDPAATLNTVLDLRPAAVIDLGVFDQAARAAIRATGTRILSSVPSNAVDDPNHIIGRLQAEEMLRVPTRRLVYAMVSDEREDPYGPFRAEGAADAAR
jgi:DNA-binding LacI/PurR family transcriptional regulator